MATSRLKKSGQLTALEKEFQSAKGIAFAHFRGATVNEVQLIRRNLRKQGMSYTVVKKTLIAIAAKNTGKGSFASELLEGPVAVIVSSVDEIAPAATIKQLKKDTFNKAKKTSRIDFAGALFAGELLNAKQAAALADTPTREQSLAKIMGMLRSGPQKLHGVLNSGFQKVYNVLQNADKFAAK